MLAKSFKFANKMDDDRTMLVEGRTYVFQGNVDPEMVAIMNPNDGKRMRRAFMDASPMLLGTNHGAGWSYYSDAIITHHHPHAADPDFVGLYVLDRNKARVEPEAGFFAMRQAQIKEAQARGIETYRPQAQSSAQVITFGARRKAVPDVHMG